MRVATALVILALALPRHALAQEPSPPQILGSLVMLAVIGNECGFDLGSRQALSAAGQRLQGRLRVPAEVVDNLFMEYARDTKGMDCRGRAARFDAEAAELIGRADKAVAVPRSTLE